MFRREVVTVCLEPSDFGLKNSLYSTVEGDAARLHFSSKFG